MNARVSMNSPAVSVIMPVYNGAAYLRAAMDSVLGQTLRDLELIVIDDGSNDTSADIAASYDDARVRFLQNPQNLGLPRTRNRGIESARGRYIAFLDSDDIALPERLERQIDYLERHPDIAGVGASARPIDSRGNVTGADWRCPGDAAYCRAMLLFRAYLVTSTFTVHASILREFFFDLAIGLAEDFNLYNRISEQYGLVNLDETLVLFRVHQSSTTATRKQALREAIESINKRQLAALGINATDHELDLHRHLEWLDMPPGRQLLADLSYWLMRVIAHNDSRLVYDPRALRKAAASRWHTVCEDALRHGCRAAWQAYYASPLARSDKRSLTEHFKLAARLVYPRRLARSGG